ncbi:hypothetical protein L810_3737 [Burkholderia sp. AU4i]|nr:hypothetical protein L810_3737 [Burkholderia sp. AU4i]MDW9244026.1 hypothetical protein [Burkholderia cepacia]
MNRIVVRFCLLYDPCARLPNSGTRRAAPNGGARAAQAGKGPRTPIETCGNGRIGPRGRQVCQTDGVP